jgi:hypothetical protein
MNTVKGHKKRHIYLFNDILLVGSKVGTRITKPEVIFLKDCMVWDVRDDEGKEWKYFKIMLL